MYCVVVKSFRSAGIEEDTYKFDTYKEALDWVKSEYPDAEELDTDEFKDYESDSIINIY